MNERIKELWSQSENELDQDFASGKIPINIDRYWLDLMQEKFTELIVRECICKIMQRKEEAIDNDWRVDESMSAAISDISEHFGVEE